jgi:hypothetical protein
MSSPKVDPRVGECSCTVFGIPFAGALKVVSQEVLAWRRGDDAPA